MKKLFLGLALLVICGCTGKQGLVGPQGTKGDNGKNAYTLNLSFEGDSSNWRKSSDYWSLTIILPDSIRITQGFLITYRFCDMNEISFMPDDQYRVEYYLKSNTFVISTISKQIIGWDAPTRCPYYINILIF